MGKQYSESPLPDYQIILASKMMRLPSTIAVASIAGKLRKQCTSADYCALAEYAVEWGLKKLELVIFFAFFLGLLFHFLVRRRAEHYILVGECYVDGMMGGEKIPEDFDPKFPETYGDLVLEQFILR